MTATAAHVLSQQDHDHFREHGYVIVPDAVPASQLRATIDEIHEYLGGFEKSRWYKDPYTDHGFLPLYHLASMWANRTSPRVYGAFADLYDQRELSVGVDRVCVKLPASPQHPGWSTDSFIHWDIDVTKGIARLGTQSVLALTDTGVDQGGFQCVPGSHNRIEEIIASQPGKASWRRPDTSGLDVTPIPLKAGDLLIWHVGLLHGSGANHSDRLRYAQYIKLGPASPNPKARRASVRQYELRIPPGGFQPGEPSWEVAHGRRTELSSLGRKIVGYDAW